jgi:hypothetical protein
MLALRSGDSLFKVETRVIVLDDTRHDVSELEAKWTADELATLNLYVIQADTVPEGKQSVSGSDQLVWRDGYVVRVYEHEDIPSPSLQPLTKRQLVAALIEGAAMFDPETTIIAAINTITDVRARARALNDWSNAQEFHRDYQLFHDPEMLAAAGFVPEQVDALWALGQTFPV